MDDVIISSEQRPEPQPQPKPQPVKAPAKKQNIQKPKKRRKFFIYFLDLLQKTLIASLLAGINFVLFCGAGSMGVFGAQALPADEVLMILAGITALCFAFVFLFSFSEFLQNLFLAAVAAAVFLATMNQFALFDKGAVLYDWAKLYAGNDSSYFSEYSHYILAALVALVMFVFGKTARKSTVTYFIGILLLIFAGIVFDSYIERNKDHNFRVVYENPADNPNEKGKKFVYIAMPNLASYSYLQSVAKDNPKAQKALAAMLGFYNDNGFTMYTNAMAADKDAVKNLVGTLNAGSNKKTETFVLKKPWTFGNWDFSRVNSDRVYLKNNKIFDVLSRSGYEINAYQTRGLELCLKNNGPAANHCVEKNNFPLNIGGNRLTTTDKVLVLAGEWLESTGLVKGSSILYSVLDAFLNVDNVPFVGTSYDRLYVVDSFKVLDRVAADIAGTKKDAAYFVNMDLPADMYVYDEFCRIKPINLWTRKDDLNFGQPAPLTKKRDAYFDQLACTYGSLQAFMDKLHKNGQAKNTVLIIQGLSGLDDNITTVAAENLQNRQSVSMAIRDPLRQGFGIKKEICLAPEILQKYLFKKGKCQPEKALGVHAEVYKNLVKVLDERKITKEDIGNASKKFKAWYQEWKKAQKVSGSVGKPKAVLPKTGTAPVVGKAALEAGKAKVPSKVGGKEVKPAGNIKKTSDPVVSAKEKSVSIEQKTEQDSQKNKVEQPKEKELVQSEPAEKQPMTKENIEKTGKGISLSPEKEPVVITPDDKAGGNENAVSGETAAEQSEEQTKEEDSRILSPETVSEFDELGDELGIPGDVLPEENLPTESGTEEMKAASPKEAEKLAINDKNVGTLMQLDEPAEQLPASLKEGAEEKEAAGDVQEKNTAVSSDNSEQEKTEPEVRKQEVY